MNSLAEGQVSEHYSGERQEAEGAAAGPDHSVPVEGQLVPGVEAGSVEELHARPGVPGIQVVRDFKRRTVHADEHHADSKSVELNDDFQHPLLEE